MIGNLAKQLYPTGRAFKLPKGSRIELFQNSINEPLQDWYDDLFSLYDQLLPDNDNFTDEDAQIWEVRLGIKTTGTLEQRKLAIARKLNHPGNTLGRMSLEYFQGQLQAAGFNVYVHRNKFDDGQGGYTVINPGDGTGSYTQHGSARHGVSVHGISGFIYDSIIANHVDKSMEITPIYSDDQLKSTFFIGGQNFPNIASVPIVRESEFRKLILSLKSQCMVGYLLINYTL